VTSLNDPELVRQAYADEKRYAARMAKQETATGPDPYDVVFAAVAERQPRDVLEVGCGRGELAERMSRELSAHVIALDQSARMVELTAARGVEAIIGDVVDLPFRDGGFDCAVAAWMLYHASDLDRAMEELRRVLRPDGRLVAATQQRTESRGGVGARRRDRRSRWGIHGRTCRRRSPPTLQPRRAA
jgi:SAM-dependent methyltransferase